MSFNSENGGIIDLKQNGKEAIMKRKKRPKKRPIRHGGFALLNKANMYMAPATSIHSCDPCPLKDHCDYYKPGASCEILDVTTASRFKQILEMEHILPEQKGMVWMVVKLEAFCWLIDTYLGLHGIFRETEDGTDLQPILKAYNSYQNSLRLAYTSCGLTPASLKDAMAIRKDGRGLAGAIRAAEDAEVLND